ncbi:MAG TPA: hypothetical protein VJS30_14180 [Paraburkholderia sp.]|nr:hypothetical protein [Paraburkholderia sp.]
MQIVEHIDMRIEVLPAGLANATCNVQLSCILRLSSATIDQSRGASWRAGRYRNAREYAEAAKCRRGRTYAG